MSKKTLFLFIIGCLAVSFLAPEVINAVGSFIGSPIGTPSYWSKSGSELTPVDASNTSVVIVNMELSGSVDTGNLKIGSGNLQVSADGNSTTTMASNGSTITGMATTTGTHHFSSGFDSSASSTIESNLFVTGSINRATSTTANELTISGSQPIIMCADTNNSVSMGDTLCQIDFFNTDGSAFGNQVNARIEARAFDQFGRTDLHLWAGAVSDPTFIEGFSIVAQNPLRYGFGTTSPASTVHIEPSSGTTTIFIDTEGAGVGGRIIFRDDDAGGCTQQTCDDGNCSFKAVTCPDTP